ncbi:tRNA pseudouridine(55) synthase TruB [Buchnera aphidicola (Aphis craccivora)]|uniref:tRNA pseudouridine synthase B n=1 Tax=Buchnera aphidicola (Aphis craccivora) TaxID=466616 RepID=A0A4D6XNB1_9GAMM|nr:tRNA pseudouridine(55) synthase TruB [Buchnera aphidicola]QCI16617.1 tRNA pseudouridine(55) synthase TruB [Buchnera aphidicola (Aphis craccivora)]QLL40751.1 tRNA pseudouridine(55) synthase TruB [Buchnera aphidicola (Aphis craccivore)]WAI17590.1 MAG: tRNA pseudouridine(55) synthase TruB [Buchnera aphidicola (Aphis craccivora)]
MFFYKKRDINGFLLIDKPIGISSNNTLQQVKSIFHAKKAGYIGTLDPLASGMLPVCFGESTKFSCYLNNSDKKYNVVAKLGEKTSTFDSDGIIIKKRDISFTHIELDKTLKELTGFINQIPSMYSAIKHNGVPLYKYARQGLNIPRNIRQIKIYKLTLVSQKNNLIELNVHCSKGTYIRTLIDDLGEKLGCGAHVISLRRTQVGLLSYSKLVTIPYLKELSNKKNINQLDNLLMPVDTPVCFLPKVYLSYKESFNFKLGKKISFKSYIKNSLVRVLEKEKKIFLGLGEIYTEEILIPYRLISMSNS